MLRALDIIPHILRIILGAVLVAAAISKSLNPSESAFIVQTLFGFHKLFAAVVILLIIYIEAYMGFSLLFNSSMNIAGVVLFFLIMTTVSLIGWILGYRGSCGCFPGLIDSSFGVVLFIRNILLTSIAIILYLLRKRMVISTNANVKIYGSILAGFSLSLIATL
ncbi:hypothetical protein KA005_29015, partial [bacterium]|nr:hypothetical protein [bacterium]